MSKLLGLQLGEFYRSQRLQQALKVILGLILCLGTILMPAAIASAAGDLSRQPVTEITVSLGNEAGELKFFPNLLEFESGKRYKLVLKNPSSQKHYFTAKNFADASWTQNVRMGVCADEIGNLQPALYGSRTYRGGDDWQNYDRLLNLS
jgi:hypothetical protein